MRTACVVRRTSLVVALMFAVIPWHAVSAQPTTTRVWITFCDKGPVPFTPQSSAWREAYHRLSSEALQRRKQAHPNGELVTSSDEAIYGPYLERLKALDVLPVCSARWENAISANVTASQRIAIASLPFVTSVRPVGVVHHLSHVSADDVVCSYDPIISSEAGSWSQLNRIHVTPLQAMGFDGTGIRYGFTDDGFRWRAVSGLKHLKVDREYDYINHDSVTANEFGDSPDQDGHGTETLSTATGLDSGVAAGAAHGATMFLAKTEDLRSETPVEEDYFAEALEDMERWGVQVTSTSLGYFTFDSGFVSHTYADLDGHTTVAARAASHAASLGVVVVVAMGNSGDKAQPHLGTPADADSIISVGALDVNDSIAKFSSRGPTYDGRIKPDVCAPGVAVNAQTVFGDYKELNGTSLATPLVSSACCLILQVHPTATATAIREALRATASQAMRPDTAYGWGAVNAYGAALYLGDIVRIMNVNYDGALHLCVALASAYGISSAQIEYTTRTGGTQTVPLVLAADSLIYSANVAADPDSEVRYRVLLTNGRGMVTMFPDTGFESVFTRMPTAGATIQLTPNPVHERATIVTSDIGDCTIYDVTGRAVLHRHILTPNGTTLELGSLATGAYFVTFVANDGSVATASLLVLP